ncbi:MAG: fluoride efflux transporter CrcB [Candidatus Thorarchaeota archaeon]|nr:fluoride efflux transporter CrcB [Candidatus Thorarchaeota archaeon]
MRDIVLVGLGGFVGAVLRYILSGVLQTEGESFPVGTLFVNFTGTLILGFVVYSAEFLDFISHHMGLFLTMGVLGAFTTMSTFGLEAFRMFESGNYVSLAVYIVGTIALVFIGMFIARNSAHVLCSIHLEN